MANYITQLQGNNGQVINQVEQIFNEFLEKITSLKGVARETISTAGMMEKSINTLQEKLDTFKVLVDKNSEFIEALSAVKNGSKQNQQETGNCS